MRRTTVWLGVSAVALILSACSKPADKAAGTAPAPGGPQPVSAMAIPAPAPGLWKQTIAAAGHAQDVRICIAADTGQQMSLMSAGIDAAKCSKHEAYRGAEGITVESVCDMGRGETVTTKNVFSGDMTSHYKMSMTGVTSHGTSNTTVDAVREGDCPDGWKGGDMEVRGMKMNILDVQKKAEQLRGLSGKVKLN